MIRRLLAIYARIWPSRTHWRVPVDGRRACERGDADDEDTDNIDDVTCGECRVAYRIKEIQ